MTEQSPQKDALDQWAADNVLVCEECGQPTHLRGGTATRADGSGMFCADGCGPIVDDQCRWGGCPKQHAPGFYYCPPHTAKVVGLHEPPQSDVAEGRQG